VSATCQQLGLPRKTAPALMTQHQIAELWGVGKCRVGQIENRALHKLKKAIEYEAAKAGVSVRDWLYGDE